MKIMKTKMSELTSQETLSLLIELGDGETANQLKSLIEKEPTVKNQKFSTLPDTLEIENSNWRGTEHTYGFIEVDGDSDDFFTIKPATTLIPDENLKNKQINIKLGSLYTMNYPGWGRHNVLMHFKCKHSKKNSNETTLIEFEQKFKSKEGEGAGNIGDFIFSGLRVPKNGMQFEIQTINISNENDDEALKILESDTIKNGLDLANATFATLQPFSKMTSGVLNLLLNRNKNKIVQEFTLGFDFDTNATDIAKLRLGTYVVVQVKKNELPWNQWIYQRSTGLVVNKSDNSIRLPYNHITFNVLPHN